MENWDDDDFVIGGDDLTFRNGSSAALLPTRRRDSGSSHFSCRSDVGSWNGEEEKQVHIPGDDEKSTLEAIAAAENAGIPLPKNVPSSALMGGTIRRLGGKKIRRIIQDDWENDLELPDTSQTLKIKTQATTDFPDTLRQVSGSSVHSSPTKPRQSVSLEKDGRRDSSRSITSVMSAKVDLDKFKDLDDDDDFFGDGGDTIKVPKSRTPKPIPLITPPTPLQSEKSSQPEDDFELDLELPSDGKLKLSTKMDIPRTPSAHTDDLDWGEGSLGTRFGGTRRDGRSNRSSSASALSPSVSSSITAESEDETFEGLVLPAGPVNFGQRLQHRRKSRSPERILEEPEEPPKKASAEPERLDFLDGLEIGDGDVFDSSKLTLHRNIKVRDARPASPARPKAAVSLTFTSKPSVHTRIPRLSHERAHSTPLEPVSESGGPITQRNRRSQSRMGHAAQSSISSIPAPASPPAAQQPPPSTPRRKEVANKMSLSSLRPAPTTTSAQLLKQKRSLPAIRALNSPAKATAYRPERPSSRSDNHRPPSVLRPKTPVERLSPGSADSYSSHAKKASLPFLPAGPSQSQSQHVTSKPLRSFRRHDSDNSIDFRPNSRTISRSTMRSPSPQRYRVAADTWERLSKPKNKKQFGDGHELDAFDDLPTSRETETKYLRQPITSGPKSTLRNKVYQNILPDRMSTPLPSTPFSPAKMTHTPHFARDTAASRIARETSLAHRASASGPLAPLTTQRVSQLSSRTNLSPQPLHSPTMGGSAKRTKRPRQLKPHLIANLNSGKDSKSKLLSMSTWVMPHANTDAVVNGMFYNAETYRWEGNENVLNAFEPPVSTPTAASVPPQLIRDKDATPRPALITNISATKGVQVVGGMVFDPQNMCWLKLGQPTKTASEASDPLDGFDGIEEEDDVFKDIPDLDDTTGVDEGGQGRVSDVKDDWLVGEEFDVGPEFIRRQREEEDRWRKKCEKWVSRGPRDRETWRWTIRELVSQFDDLPM